MVEDPTRTRQVQVTRALPRIATLEIRTAGQPPRRVTLEGDVVIIGRSRDVQLHLDIDGVSRRHARITRNGERGYSLVDLGAKNGTFLNGERVDVAALHHGDRILIGAAELTLSFEHATDGPADEGVDTRAPAEDALRAQLTAREWEVAQAVAQGLTNAEIAAQLGIGRRTVATHLERIFERLGLHSRAALAHRIAPSRADG